MIYQRSEQNKQAASQSAASIEGAHDNQVDNMMGSVNVGQLPFPETPVLSE